MKYFYLYLLIACIGISCKKDRVAEENTNNYKADITIQQVIDDSTIVLKWHRYPGKNFRSYWLQRRALYIKNGKLDWYYDALDSSTNVNDTVFTETRMPVARDVVYSVFIRDANNNFLASDFVSYQRPPSTLFYGLIRDVLIDKDQKKLYIIQKVEKEWITVVDYTTGRQVNAVDLNSTGSGNCALGDFNGNKEIYLTFGGAISIFDATSLTYKDAIYCGSGATAVVSVNGNLYVSTGDTTGGTTECLKVYDRATKKLIGRTGFRSKTKLLFLTGSSVEMIDASIPHVLDQPPVLSYYQFSETGIPLLKKQNSNPGTNKVAPDFMRSFPDGSKFITSYSGSIFTKSLVFERYLKENGSYADFAFNDEGSIIYAADAYAKKIDVIKYPEGTVTKSYPTQMHPFKIFRDGNTLVCLNITAPDWYHSNFCFVESIHL